MASATVLLKDAPRQQAALGRLARLPESEKRQAARTAIAAVLADGHVVSAEVKFLERLYKALGYSRDDVYAALHRGGVAVDQPVTVAAAQPSRGIPIPPRPLEAKVVEIDAARLERIRAETSAVSSLLAEIFVEDTPLPPTPPVASTGPSAFAGLDAAHAELLAAVLASGAMPREAFDARARTLRLLPDGAIETINEWGFETLDEAILDDGDDVTVGAHLRARLEDVETTAA